MHDTVDPQRESAPGSSVVWRRMTGVGCFGKPDTLINMLNRVMMQYERAVGRVDALSACPASMGCAVRQLMIRLSSECRAPRFVSPSTNDSRERVAGFLFYMDHDRARIRVFTRNEATPSLRLA